MRVALAGRRAPRPKEPASVRWVIAAHVARSALRGAVIWGVVFGLFVVATIQAFVTAYPTVGERLKIVTTLQSFSILLGVPRHAETVAGFTSWRVLVAVTVIGAIWGLLTSTGLLRGEEEAGRWELLLAGQTTRRRAAAEALLGLGGALAAMFVATALVTILAGQLPGANFPLWRSLLFALALVSGAGMFLAVGALTSQFGATRGQAALLASAVLGVSYAIRMVADSRTSLGWMRWLSPIGWLEELRPLQDTQPLALLPIAALVAVCAGLTVLLAGWRDLNGSLLREREAGLGHPRWLVGPTSLAVRLAGPTALAWLVGMASFAFMLGFVARSSTTLLASSPAFMAALSRLGVRRASESYLGVAFLMVAVVVAVIAASQIAAIRDEEATGRLENLLARPVRRTAWLVGRLSISLALLVLTGLAAGLFAWAGAASQRTGVALPRLLEAGLNATVPAIFVLGAGALVLGLRPRLSAPVAYAIVAWSFLVNMVGALIKGNRWLRETSLFAHMALAPAAKPDWETAAVIVLLGVGAATVGVLAFQRRDLEYE